MRKKYKNIEELIFMLKAAKQDMEERISALEASPNTIDEELLRKYIETRSTAKTAEYARSKGIRSPKGLSFAPGDVSDLVCNDNPNINPALFRLARDIFSANSRAVFLAYG